MKSIEKNAWQGRYYTTAAIVFLIIIVIITISGEEVEEKSKETQEYRLSFIYHVTEVFTKVESKTKFQF